MKTRYGQVVLLLVIVLVLSLGLTAFLGVRRTEKESGKLSVVASFYPMYTATLQVVGESDGVTVSCLAQPTAGCLHDYQLSPAERLTLEQADVLILNGAGAEAFLEPLLPQLSAVTVETAGESHEEHDHGDHTHSDDQHAWVNPAHYRQQVQAICDALCEADPERAAMYRENTVRYCEQIDAVATRLSAAASALSADKAVLFHDSMGCLAEALGLEVVGRLPIGEEQGFSAADIREVAEAVKGEAVLFLYDSQYAVLQEGLTSYAENGVSGVFYSAVLPVDGVKDKDAWLQAMEKNIRELEKVTV